MTKKYHVLMSEIHSVNKVSCGDYIEAEDQGCEMGGQEFCEIEEYEDD